MLRKLLLITRLYKHILNLDFSLNDILQKEILIRADLATWCEALTY